MEKLKKDFYKSPEAQYTREYNRIRARVGKLSKKIASAEGSEKIALVACSAVERGTAEAAAHTLSLPNR